MAADGAHKDERSKRVVALLEDCVRTELQVTSGMLELGLTDDVIESLMLGVASGVLNGFDLDWTHRRPHHWAESGQHFARCRTCLLDSPPNEDAQAALSWVQEHEQTHR